MNHTKLKQFIGKAIIFVVSVLIAYGAGFIYECFTINLRYIGFCQGFIFLFTTNTLKGILNI